MEKASATWFQPCLYLRCCRMRNAAHVVTASTEPEGAYHYSKGVACRTPLLCRECWVRRREQCPRGVLETRRSENLPASVLYQPADRTGRRCRRGGLV